MSLRLKTSDGRTLEGQPAFDYWVTALSNAGRGTLKPDGRGGYIDIKTGKTYPAGSFSMGSGFTGPGLSIGGDQWLTPDGSVHDQHTALKLISTLALPIGAEIFGGGAGAGASTSGYGPPAWTSADEALAGGGSAAGGAAGGLAAGGFEKWFNRVVGLAGLVGGGINSYLSGENQQQLIKIQQDRLALEKKAQADAEAARQARIGRLQPYVDTGGAALNDLYRKMGFGSAPPPASGGGSTGNTPPQPPPNGSSGGPQPAPAPAPDVPADVPTFNGSTLAGMPTGGTGGGKTRPSSAPAPGLVGLRDDHGQVMYVPRGESADYLARGFQWVG